MITNPAADPYKVKPDSLRFVPANGPISPQDVGSQKSWRIDVWESTRACILNGAYLPTKEGDPIEIPQPDLNIRPMVTQQLTKIPCNKQGKLPKIVFYKGDCLDAARDLYVAYDGAPPLVMNCANARHACGGLLAGSRAQEEQLCRRSTLAFQQDPSMGMQSQDLYPLNPEQNRKCDGIFVPNATVFRGGDAEEYAYLPKPFKIHVGNVAATSKPELINNGAQLAKGPEMDLYVALQCFFRMATSQNIKTLVPGSLGCGAFLSPPAHVAFLMMYVISTECVDSCVEEIRFGIYEDHNSMKLTAIGNFETFVAAGIKQFGANIQAIDGQASGGDKDITQEMLQKYPPQQQQQQQQQQQPQQQQQNQAQVQPQQGQPQQQQQQFQQQQGQPQQGQQQAQPQQGQASEY